MDLLHRLLSEDFEGGYHCWKVRRKRLLKEMKPILLNFTEEQLASVFELWISMISANTEKGEVVQIKRTCMVVSMLCYFMRDPLIAQISKPFIEVAMESEDRTVIRILGKTSYWFVHQCSAKIVILEMFGFGRVISSWFKNREKVFKAISMLHHSLKLGIAEAIKCFSDNFEVISQATQSEDRELQAVAVKIVLVYARIVKLSIGREVLERLVEDCLRGMSALDTARCHLVVVEMKQLHKILHSTVMIDIDPRRVVDPLVSVLRRCDGPTDLLAAQYFLEIARVNRNDIDVREAIKVFCEKGTRFSSVIAEAVELFGKDVDFDSLVEWVGHHKMESGCSDGCPYIVLKAVLRMGVNAKVEGHLCPHFVRCIELDRDLVSDEIIQKAREVLESGNGCEQEVLSTIALSGMFPLRFANTMEEFVMKLSKYQLDKRENVRQECTIVLGGLGTTEALDMLLIIARSDSNKHIRIG